MELVVVSSEATSVVVVAAASVVVAGSGLDLEPFAGRPGNPLPIF